ncbi:MAG: zinc ribbon domain-containing protein [Comamonadaceae bacterium]|nr:zinc ribbon domain-containing protein [Comamonadaceae bacterium]
MPIKCRSCGSSNRDTAKFCLDCGTVLTATPVTDPATQPAPMAPVCPQCLGVNAFEAKFCKACGFKLADSTPEVGVQSEPADDDQTTVVFKGFAKPIAPMAAVLEATEHAQPGEPSIAEPTIAEPLKPVVAPSRNPLPDEPPPRDQRSAVFWLGIVGLLVVTIALAAGGWFWSQRQATPDSQAVAPGNNSTLTPAPVPPTPAVVPVPEPTQPATVSDVVSPVTVATPVSAAKPALPIVQVPVSRPAKPAAAASTQKLPMRNMASSPIATPNTAPDKSTPAPMPAAAATVPPTTTSPSEICSTRLVLTRSLCMHEQCSSAQFQSHPQCIELRQQQKEAAERQAQGR